MTSVKVHTDISTVPNVPMQSNTSGTGVSKDCFFESTATGSGEAAPEAVTKAVIPKKSITAAKVADWLVNFCHQHGDVITNMRLQRLLYFAQAWYLAIHDEPLFADSIEAWPSGPVQPDAYQCFITSEHRPIESRRPNWRFSKQVEQHLYDLMTAYGTLNAFELELQSQRDLPWIEARAGLPADAGTTPEISNRTMKAFYRKRLNTNEQKEQGAKG